MAHQKFKWPIKILIFACHWPFSWPIYILPEITLQFVYYCRCTSSPGSTRNQKMCYEFPKQWCFGSYHVIVFNILSRYLRPSKGCKFGIVFYGGVSVLKTSYRVWMFSNRNTYDKALERPSVCPRRHSWRMDTIHMCVLSSFYLRDQP